MRMTSKQDATVSVSLCGDNGWKHEFTRKMSGDDVQALLMLVDGKVSSAHILILPSILTALLNYQRYGVGHLYSGAGPTHLKGQLDTLAEEIKGAKQ